MSGAPPLGEYIEDFPPELGYGDDEVARLIRVQHGHALPRDRLR
jgi:hypothetical protein